VDPSGRFAYVVDYGYAALSAYSINPTTGVLAPLPWADTCNFPEPAAVYPSGRFLYEGCAQAEIIDPYTIGSDGSLAWLGTDYPENDSPSAIAMDPLGRFAYVTNYFNGNVSSYSVNKLTGALTGIGPNAPSGTYPYSAAVDPSGRFTYVANPGSNDVSTYSIDQTTGLLTSLGPNVHAGNGASSIAIVGYFP